MGWVRRFQRLQPVHRKRSKKRVTGSNFFVRVRRLYVGARLQLVRAQGLFEPTGTRVDYIFTKNDRRRWGDSNTMPEGTHRLAVELGTNADSHLRSIRLEHQTTGAVFRAKLRGGERRYRTPNPWRVRTVFETGLIPDQFILQ